MNSLAHVTAEQAKQFKEQGFNWPVNKSLRYTSHHKTYSEEYIHSVPVDFNSYGKLYYSLPTLAFACQWLREEKGLHVYVEYLFEGNTWGYGLQDIEDSDSFLRDEGFPDHDTALIAGIDKALTILKERA